MPTAEQVAELIELRLATMELDPETVQRVATSAEGLSFADVAGACDEAIRIMVLDDRRALAERDLVEAFARTVGTSTGLPG
jgi:ATP-dependent 26S proteasome regulatory subunit